MAIDSEVIICCLLMEPTLGGQWNFSKFAIGLSIVMVQLLSSAAYYWNLKSSNLNKRFHIIIVITIAIILIKRTKTTIIMIMKQ